MEESRHTGALITAVRAGAEGAWEDFLTAYGRRLYGYFFRATRSHHVAEDLLGEMMLRLVRKMGEYDDRGRFEPWLFRIAANLVRDRIRRSKARPATMSLDSSDDEQVGMSETVRGPADPVDAGLLAGESSDALAEALEKLPERSRQMVLLRHFGDMSYREIAEIYDCPVGTVLARVHRALKTLRTVLETSDEHTK
ncbi:MAG: sigma-70 family RNA polymerase sigma factor [Phycisphaerae bacterium]|nr:sigma-70 family RNA polymerase sigma factor [Phycisphaerae bacterium]